MRPLVFLILFSFLSCKNNTENRVISKNLDKVVSENAAVKLDTCENLKKILRIVNKTILTNKIEYIDTSQFKMIFKENNNYKEGCYFPNNDLEYKLLYQFTDCLVKMSSYDKLAIQLLTFLEIYNTTNAEYSEVFMSLIPELAIDNITLFIEALSPLSYDVRKNTIEELGNISDRETVRKLILELGKIKNPDLSKTIKQVSDFLHDDNNFDF
jgi:hypothetical protein